MSLSRSFSSGSRANPRTNPRANPRTKPLRERTAQEAEIEALDRRVVFGQVHERDEPVLRFPRKNGTFKLVLTLAYTSWRAGVLKGVNGVCPCSCLFGGFFKLHSGVFVPL